MRRSRSAKEQTMDPRTRRRTRLILMLAVALLLAGALVYTSFSAASPTRTPAQLLAAARPATVYQLTGNVAAGSIRRHDGRLDFRVRDRNDSRSVPVGYVGTVPDAFEDNREIIISVRRRGRGFVGVPGSLITKCPSKFTVKR
jgi:cytochrome c-type biogenesis protein CcmE